MSHLSFGWRLNYQALMRAFVWADEHDLRLVMAYGDELGLLAET